MRTKPLMPDSDQAPVLTKRQQQALVTKDKIFTAAMDVINRKGFNNATIEEITSQAGVASGSFYTYFKSKEAIIIDTVRRSDVFYAYAYQQLEPDAFPAMLTQFMRLSYTEYEKRGKGIIKAIISNYFVFPCYTFYPEDRALLQCLYKLVNRGIQEGELDKTRPAADYVSQILAVMSGVEVQWCFDDTEKSLVEMMAETVHTLACGMIKKHGG